MNEDYVKKLFQAIGGEEKGYDYDLFVQRLSDSEEYNKAVFNAIGGEEKGYDYNQFTTLTGNVKKKEEQFYDFTESSQPTSQQQDVVSASSEETSTSLPQKRAGSTTIGYKENAYDWWDQTKDAAWELWATANPHAESTQDYIDHIVFSSLDVKKYEQYNFGESEDLVNSLQDEYALQASKVLAVIKDEVSGSDELKERLVEAEIRRKEIKEDWQRYKEFGEGPWKESFTYKNVYLPLTPENVEAKLINEKFSNQFIDRAKPALIEQLRKNLPEDIVNDEEKFKEYLEVVTDKLFFENGLNLDLDGDARYNDQAFVIDMYKNLKVGIQGITDPVEYMVKSGVNAIQYDDEEYDKAMKQLRTDINTDKEKLAQSLTQFDAGIVDSFANGDIGNGVHQIIGSTVQSVPIIAFTAAASAATGGTATGVLIGALGSGVLSGVDTYLSVRDITETRVINGEEQEIEVYGEAGAMGYALTTGAGEALFSLVGGRIMKRAAAAGRAGRGGGFSRLAAQAEGNNVRLRDLFRKELLTNGTFRETLKSYARGYAARKGVAIAEEGATEFLTGITDAVADQLATGEKVDMSAALKQGLEGGIVGGAAGFIFESLGQLGGVNTNPNMEILSLIDSKDPVIQREILSLEKEYKSLQDQLDGTKKPSERKEIVEKMDELQKRHMSLIESRVPFYEMVRERNPEAFAGLKTLNAKTEAARIEARNAKRKLDKAKKKGKDTESLEKIYNDKLEVYKKLYQEGFEARARFQEEPVELTEEESESLFEKKLSGKLESARRQAENSEKDLESLLEQQEDTLGTEGYEDTSNAIEVARKNAESSRRRYERIRELSEKLERAKAALEDAIDLSQTESADPVLLESASQAVADIRAEIESELGLRPATKETDSETDADNIEEGTDVTESEADIEEEIESSMDPKLDTEEEVDDVDPNMSEEEAVSQVLEMAEDETSDSQVVSVADDGSFRAPESVGGSVLSVKQRKVVNQAVSKLASILSQKTGKKPRVIFVGEQGSKRFQKVLGGGVGGFQTEINGEPVIFVDIAQIEANSEIRRKQGLGKPSFEKVFIEEVLHSTTFQSYFESPDVSPDEKSSLLRGLRSLAGDKVKKRAVQKAKEYLIGEGILNEQEASRLSDDELIEVLSAQGRGTIASEFAVEIISDFIAEGPTKVKLAQAKVLINNIISKILPNYKSARLIDERDAFVFLNNLVKAYKGKTADVPKDLTRKKKPGIRKSMVRSENTISPYDLPQGQFEVEYNEAWYRKGVPTGSTPRKRTFNNYQHFVNWWKKVGRMSSASTGEKRWWSASKDNLGGYNRLPAFSDFRFNGQEINVLELRADFGGSPTDFKVEHVKIRHRGSASYAGIKQDLTDAVNDGILTKEQADNILSSISSSAVNIIKSEKAAESKGKSMAELDFENVEMGTRSFYKGAADRMEMTRKAVNRIISKKASLAKKDYTFNEEEANYYSSTKDSKVRFNSVRANDLYAKLSKGKDGKMKPTADFFKEANAKTKEEKDAVRKRILQAQEESKRMYYCSGLESCSSSKKAHINNLKSELLSIVYPELTRDEIASLVISDSIKLINEMEGEGNPMVPDKPYRFAVEHKKFIEDFVSKKFMGVKMNEKSSFVSLANFAVAITSNGVDAETNLRAASAVLDVMLQNYKNGNGFVFATDYDSSRQSATMESMIGDDFNIQSATIDSIIDGSHPISKNMNQQRREAVAAGLAKLDVMSRLFSYTNDSGAVTGLNSSAFLATMNKNVSGGRLLSQSAFGLKVGAYALLLNGNNDVAIMDSNAQNSVFTSMGEKPSLSDESLKSIPEGGVKSDYRRVQEKLIQHGVTPSENAVEALRQLQELKERMISEGGVSKETRAISDLLRQIIKEGGATRSHKSYDTFVKTVRRVASDLTIKASKGEFVLGDPDQMTPEERSLFYRSEEEYRTDKTGNYRVPLSVVTNYLYADNQIASGRQYTPNHKIKIEDILEDAIELTAPAEMSAHSTDYSQVTPQPSSDVKVTRGASFVVDTQAIERLVVDGDTEAKVMTVSPPKKIGRAVPTSDAKAYAEAMSQAVDRMKASGSLLNLQVDKMSQSELEAILEEGGYLFMSEDGMAGAYVKSDGYMGGLFKDPSSKLKGISKDMQDARVAYAGDGVFFDAYATKLESIYVKNGFKPVARIPFNPEFAPEGWDKPNSPLKDKPDVVFFVKGEGKVGDGEVFEDYDDAYSYTVSQKPKGSDISGGYTRLSFNEGVDNLPRTEDGRLVESADVVLESNGEIYVKGKISFATDSKNIEGRTKSKPIRKTNKDGTIDRDYELARERLGAVIEASGRGQLSDAELDDMMDSVSDKVVSALYSADGKAEVARKEKQSSVRFNRIRQTAGKAAKTFSDVRQDILNNPENYITPQNLKSEKNRLSTLTDAELISLMRDDVLGNLQNRNDDVGPLAGAELISRAVARGDRDAIPGLVENLAKIGTTAGRLLRQMRELKNSTPEGLVSVIEAEVSRHGNKLSDDQKVKLRDLVASSMDAKSKYDDLKRKAIAGENVEEELKKAKKELDKADKALTNFTSTIIERDWSTIAGMLVQGNLLTPISHATNVGANLINLFGETFSSVIAVPVERLLNVFGVASDYPNSYSLNAYWEGIKGMGRGTVEATRMLFTGVDPDQSAEWRMERGFAPIRSLISAISKEDLPLNDKGKASLSQRMKLFVQGTVGIPAEVMFRLLALGDTPFRRFIEAKELYKAGRAQGLEGDALKSFMRHPSAKTLESAVEEGKRFTFQAETTTTRFANDAISAMEKLLSSGFDAAFGSRVIDANQVARFLMRLQVPFRSTPANIMTETLTYLSPYFAAARMANYIRKKDAKTASKVFGKAVIGSMSSQVALLLIKEGLMSGAIDWNEDEEKNLAYDQFPPNSINVSGLKRFIKGESTAKQDDDEFVSYNKLGIVGTIFGSIAKGADRTELQNRDYSGLNFLHHSITDAFGFAPMSGVSHIMDQSFLQGIDGLLSIITSVGSDDWNRASERWLNSTMKAASATVLPNSLSAFHRSQREYMPDFRVTKDMPMEERLLKTIEYTIKDRTFNTDGVPVRINWKGEPIKQTPRGNTGIAYQLFDITKSRQGESDPVSNEIWRLYENLGEISNVVGTPGYAKKRSMNVPNVRSKKMRRAIEALDRDFTWINDEEFVASSVYLNSSEINDLMAISGKERYQEVSTLMNSSKYASMNDAEKLEAINDINKNYDSAFEMDGSAMRTHSLRILNIMQDKYENLKSE